MIDLINPNHWRKYFVAAIILALVFVVIEIVPLISAINKHEYGGKAIDKAAAIEQAVSFAEAQTGYTVASSKAVHQADKIFTGYLAKEKLTDDYEKRYGNQFPTDTFQVDIRFANRNGSGFIYVNMYNGQVTGWNLSISGDALDEVDERKALERFLFTEQFRDADLNGMHLMPNGDWLVTPEGHSIGEAPLHLTAKVLSIEGKPIISKYRSDFTVPREYTDYVKKQDTLAGVLTGVGSVLMSFIMAILALIYAILYRKHTSFKYGIILTVVFFIAYVITNLNVLDGILAGNGETRVDSGVAMFTAVFTVLIGIPIAGATYLSIVAGDALWKSQGRNLWPRLGEPGYGDYIWRSMGLSYLFAIGMLGLQPLIFLGLEKSIGTWSATDISMSPYNMGILWLMPVLAWMAAISEEAVYRFFGIGLFRKWFRHTFAAAIIPTIVWALGHVMYPFYPSTTRLFELMIIGLLFSFIFVRYGFATAVFTHAIFNSVAVGSSLIIVGSAPNIISAVFFILLPVLIAYVIREWDRRKQRRLASNMPPDAFARD